MMNSDVPVAVKNITTATALSNGYNTFCSLLSNGRVDCWGNNGYGQLGNGSRTNSDVPVGVLAAS